MTIRRALTLALGLLASAAPSIAHAQDAAACKDGYDRSQVLRDAGKLVEARKLLQQCSSATCSAFIQKECVTWLSDVEARVSSVVLSAKTGAGADLVDVVVSIDGKEGPRKLDGRELDIDPGEHSFVFQLADGQKAEQTVLVREREKGQGVSVTIGAPSSDATPAASGAAAALAGSQGLGTQKVLAVVAGGIGVVGLVVGTAFGVTAISKKNDAQNACPDRCTTQDGVDKWNSAGSAGNISTAGFIVAAVGASGAAVLWLTAPTSSNNSSTLVGFGPGVLQVKGTW